MDKFRIICDQDSILADFMAGLWDAVEADIGFRPDTADVTNFYRLEDAIPESLRAIMDSEGKTVRDYFMKPGFFRGLKPIPGAQDAIRSFVKAGHEVVIVTAPSSPTSPQEKMEWLKEHFPFLDQKNVFIGHKKHMVVGNVFIDDHSDNARAYLDANPEAYVLGIAHPYNHEDAYSPGGRVDSYREPDAAWAWIKVLVEREASSVGVCEALTNRTAGKGA